MKNIEQLRKEYYLTQKEISRYLNIYQVKYSRYELKYPNIPLHIIISLSFLYDIDLYYLFGLTKVKDKFKSNDKYLLHNLKVNQKKYYRIRKKIEELERIK